MGRKKKENKMYFTQDTENAIILYNNTTDIQEKNKIFSNQIYYPLFKLSQNIIHTFKFYYTDNNNIEDIQNELIEFLRNKLSGFNEELGFKAYSYFGMISKRWCILYNKKNYKKKIEKYDVESDEVSNSLNLSYNIDNNNTNFKLNFFIEEYINHLNKNLYKIFPKEDHAKIADAILEMFRKRENINIFNKKAIYINIKEIVDVKTPNITKITKIMYDIFKKEYIFYLENDYIRFLDK
jgi:hypothetical protein